MVETLKAQGKVLLVDDDDLLLGTLNSLLTKEGYEVTAVNNAKQALEEVQKGFYPLIILDVRMPDMDGMELLKNIRKTQEGQINSMVIVITGYADDAVPIKAIKSGASDYIMKPFDISEFIYSVNRNMRLANLEIEREKFVNEIQEKNYKLEELLKELKIAQSRIEQYNRDLEQKVEERARNLNEMQTQLFQSSKMSAVGQLGAGVAHELNNPLGGILGYAQFILEKLDKDTISEDEIKACKRYVQTIEREAIRCKDIVVNLLRFSRKPVALKKEKVNIAQIIEETLLLIKHPLKLSNISVVTEFSPSLNPVIGIVNHLQQVFINILMNAQQAMKDGGTLTVKAYNSQERTGNKIPYVTVTVHDTGEGIPADIQERIFEPFFTTKDKDKGTGLGLSIVYQIIQEHSGTIKVESTPGKGTTFLLTLPVYQ